MILRSAVFFSSFVYLYRQNLFLQMCVFVLSYISIHKWEGLLQIQCMHTKWEMLGSDILIDSSNTPIIISHVIQLLYSFYWQPVSSLLCVTHLLFFINIWSLAIHLLLYILSQRLWSLEVLCFNNPPVKNHNNPSKTCSGEHLFTFDTNMFRTKNWNWIVIEKGIKQHKKKWCSAA